jgi:hypothetical protein
MSKLQQLADFLGEKMDELEVLAKGLDHSQITNVVVENVDPKDYPDFSDAYIHDCHYKGKRASDRILAIINEDGDFVYQQAWETLY